MISQLGSYALAFAVLASAGGTFAAVMAFKSDSPAALAWTRKLLLIGAGLITLAGAALMIGIINDHFEITYVAEYSEKALPLGYKIAAFWAGQAGSLLLWAWLLAAMTAALIFQQRRQLGGEPAATLAVMAVVNAFFAALILFAANPFVTQAAVADGHGLNPMLQDPGMIAHPPTLFVGYAGFTVPFAMLIGALAVGRKDDGWILATRKWLLFAWLFLSVGIVLGAQWAYIELVWGGYWAWDPVENASLLPWLTGTAVLHSIMVQQFRRGFRFWNACLLAGTFLLCIFGTYLTRSGVIQSVHTFPESPIGRFFLVFMLACFVVTLVLIVINRKMLRPDQPTEIGFNREGAFLATNVLLVIITGTVLVGTIYPLLSNFFAGKPISVGPPFYNAVVLPMALVLLALMATGPALGYGASDAKRVLGRLRLPLVAALIALIVGLLLGPREPWSLTVLAITVLGITNVFNDMIMVWWKTMRACGTGALGTLAMMVDDNHRRYGGQLVHIGMILVMVGVAGSSIYNSKTTVQLKPGESSTFAGYMMTLEKLGQERHGNYTAVQATVTLTAANGATNTLVPEVRFYDKTEQPNSQVALRMGLRRDLYVTLAGWDSPDKGGTVALVAIINPLVSWIWLGGIVMVVGTLFALTPKLLQTRPRNVTDAIDSHAVSAQGK